MFSELKVKWGYTKSFVIRIFELSPVLQKGKTTTNKYSLV